MSLKLNSLTAILMIVMILIEAFIQINGLISGDVRGARYQVFEYFGLYVGSPFYTYVSYALIHGSILHLLMNMFVTTQMAPPCESLMGKARFAAFTFLSALICGVGTYWLLTALRGQANFVLIGFSGVLFAYIGAFFRINLGIARDKWAYTKKFFTYNILLVGFIFVPLFFPSLGISGEAHIIGAIFGFAAGPVFLPVKRAA